MTIIIFMVSLAIDCVLLTTTIGTFYEENYTQNALQVPRKLTYSIPQKYFHACSMNSQCNYVVEDKTSQIKLYNTRTNIPPEEKLLRIWIKRSRYGYKIFTRSKNWHEARKICQLHYGDLASVLSKQEEDTIKELLSSFTDAQWFWFGLNDIQNEGTYVWSDGSERTYTNWGEIEPNGHDVEDCMIAKRSMKWCDAPCAWTVYFVCKIPLV